MKKARKKIAQGEDWVKCPFCDRLVKVTKAFGKLWCQECCGEIVIPGYSA